MSWRRRHWLKLGAALLPLAAWPQARAAGREVIDVGGRTVRLPTQVQRIAEGWAAHNTVLMMLGAGDRITATLIDPASKPWMLKVAPSLGKALSTRGVAFNAEQLLEMKTDVVFLLKGDKAADRLTAAGVPAVQVMFSDHASMKDCITLTAQVLGGPAIARGERYNDYLDAQIRGISAVTGKIAESQRPSVLHVASIKPLRVDGSKTIIDEWIRIAGGRNAAVGIESSLQEVGLEQILAWDPDVLILSASAAIESDRAAAWKSLRAAKSGRVLVNPEGVFPWDRYGPEAALQLPWAAQSLHPGLFKQIDLPALTRQFYKDFFAYPLDDAQAKRIIQGLPPG